jgi:hypothetical protein
LSFFRPGALFREVVHIVVTYQAAQLDFSLKPRLPILQQCGKSGLLFGNALVGPASLFCHQPQATIGLGLGA